MGISNYLDLVRFSYVSGWCNLVPGPEEPKTKQQYRYTSCETLESIQLFLPWIMSGQKVNWGILILFVGIHVFSTGSPGRSLTSNGPSGPGYNYPFIPLLDAMWVQLNVILRWGLALDFFRH